MSTQPQVRSITGKVGLFNINIDEQTQKFWIVCLVGSIMLIAFDFYLGQFTSPIPFLDPDTTEVWNWGLFAFFFQFLVYGGLSVVFIQPTELALKVVLGKEFQNLPSGMAFVPIGLCYVIRLNRLVEQKEFPGESETIWENDGPAPEGMVKPLRFTTGGKTGDSDDPLENRMTLDVRFFVRLRIRDAMLFVTTINNLPEAMKQAEDTAKGVLATEFGQRTPAELIAGQDKINGLLTESVEEKVRDWGIDVVDCRLSGSVDLGWTVNKALRDVPAAQFNAKATITNAEATRKKRILEGEGEASATLSIGTAKAEVDRRALEQQAIGYRSLLGEDVQSELIVNALAIKSAQDAIANAKNVTLIAGNGNGPQNLYGLTQTILQDQTDKRDARNSPVPDSSPKGA